MYWHDNGMSGWGWFGMSLGTLLVLTLIAGVVALIIRTSPGTSRNAGDVRPAPTPSPEQLLAERFARGEIEADEYQRRLAALRPAPPPRGDTDA